MGASTGDTLMRLAQSESAALIVFGSDYRTPPGRVEPGTSAQHLLNGGSVAVGIAPAGLRTETDGAIKSIAVPLAGPHNDDSRTTASTLAGRLGANVVESSSGPVDLIVVGSVAGAPAGRIAIGGDVRSELNSARSSVIVLPADSPIAL